jgi:hypothetical protein
MLSSAPPSLNVALREDGFTFWGFFGALQHSLVIPALARVLEEAGPEGRDQSDYTPEI